MKKKLLALVLVLAVVSAMIVPLAVSATTTVTTTVYVSNLQPSWTAPYGGGVFASYQGPPTYAFVTPGPTAVYLGHPAAPIYAGVNIDPKDKTYEDQGLLAFKPGETPIASFTTLSYDFANQYGTAPVWVYIELNKGQLDDVIYQCVPSTNPSGWHTFDAGSATNWLKWTNLNNGDTTGSTPMSLSAIATAEPGKTVSRVYLTEGMGDSYHTSGPSGIMANGTVAYVDKVTIGTTEYDFAVANNSSSVTGTFVTLTSIDITPHNPATLQVVSGGAQQFTATGHYSDGSSALITTGLTWNSSVPTVASIDATGLAIGLASGTTNITASLGSVTSNVVPLNVVGSPNTLTLNVPPTLPLGILTAGAWNVKDWGSSNLGAVTETAGTDGVSTAWTVNAKGAGYMTSTTPVATLNDPLFISPTNGSWSCADGSSPETVHGVSCSGMYTTGGSASATFDMYAAQYVETGDVAGNYGDTITFTVSFTP